MPKPQTPREVRHRLNEIEAELKERLGSLGPVGIKAVGLLDLAHKEEHADYLEEMLAEVRAQS